MWKAWTIYVKWTSASDRYVNLLMRLREDGKKPARSYYVSWDSVTGKMVENSAWNTIRYWDGAEGEAVEVIEEVIAARAMLKTKSNQ